MSDGIVEERYKKHVCQRRGFVCTRACFNGHALGAQVIEHRFEDALGQTRRLSDVLKPSPLRTLCKGAKDATILSNACGDKRERLGVGQWLQVSRCRNSHSHHTPNVAWFQKAPPLLQQPCVLASGSHVSVHRPGRRSRDQLPGAAAARSKFADRLATSCSRLCKVVIWQFSRIGAA